MKNTEYKNHDEFMYEMLLRRACEQLKLAQEFELHDLPTLGKKIREEILKTEKQMNEHKKAMDQYRANR